jgi:hypothetical protein
MWTNKFCAFTPKDIVRCHDLVTLQIKNVKKK